MKHGNIRTKFLIEYDKANITSSYPSLTDYEIATMLDKAYLALLAQKITGNNPRQAGFESDNKAISDIQPLIVTCEITDFNTSVQVANDVVYNQPDDMLYFLQAKMSVQYDEDYAGKEVYPWAEPPVYSFVEVTQVTHELALKYMCTTHNKPWVEVPVCYMESDKIIVLIDPVLYTPGDLYVTYIKNPEKFVDHMFDDTQFELSDTMAEELINLAIIFAAETVESQRLTTKVNIRPLES